MGIEFHRIWREQIAAVPDLRRKFGESVVFDYIVGEKLMLFAETAERQPAFTRELPSFVAALRGLFGPAVLRRELARLARQMDLDEAELDLVVHEAGEDWLIEAPETAAARRARFIHLQSLLTASHLGTA
ncbi:hypothetical protein ACFQY5_35370 [Paeniroseomonas aquatica]|uniref:Uncharacterized protein n=1 Tax=Paeniroseomonas aquatica TaxID=373043 RepID=A0ABT8AFI6_9PROT|nr:hypothetical protein [Paeniroseomonas aquatica]MDN3568592.1 hypothetical protein [Paeniroseomonas aquatica]